MEIQSAKAKGKRYENYIAERIREMDIDSRAGREIGSGSGKAKGDIRSTIDFLIEAKNQATINWNKSINQAEEQAKRGFHNPDRWLLVVRDPNKPEFDRSFAVMDFEQFLILYKKAMEPKLANPDRELKYLMERAKNDLNKIINKL